MPATMDHRFGHRRSCDLTAYARRRGWSGRFAGRLTDFSISGAYLEAPTDSFPLRSMVQLELLVPDGDRRPVCCRAMVVRRDKGGIGLAFERARPAGLKRLFDWGMAGYRAKAPGPTARLDAYQTSL